MLEKIKNTKTQKKMTKHFSFHGGINQKKKEKKNTDTDLQYMQQLIVACDIYTISSNSGATLIMACTIHDHACKRICDSVVGYF